jgi:ParB family transcriptional regulator, chromosome partitioning protein
MTSLTILDLPLADITVPQDRARDFSPDGLLLLAASIAAQGMFHPIRVRRHGDRYILISGMHRFLAIKGSQQTHIAAIVVEAISDDAARLDEVMENLGRAELCALDRCHHIYELKQVWERMHPETKNGGNKNVQKGLISTRSRKQASDPIKAEDMPVVFGFARELALKIGLSITQIKEAVKIWTGLDPEVRRRLVGTELATKQTELKLLSEKDHLTQTKVLDLILGNDNRISSVADALDFLKHKKVLPADERKLLKAGEAFRKLDDRVFEFVLNTNEVRIIDSLKRRGRI